LYLSHAPESLADLITRVFTLGDNALEPNSFTNGISSAGGSIKRLGQSN
jgi:hypothetical protein